MTQPTAGFGLLIPSAPEASCTARDMPRWAWVGGVSVVIVPFGDCTQPFVSTVTAASPGLGSIASMNSVAPSVMALARASLRPKLSAGRRLRMSGFSLIELMVVVAMVAILAGLAAPSFTVLLRNNRLAAASSA